MVNVTLRDKKTQYSILGMMKNIHGRFSELVGGVLLLTGEQRSLLAWLVWGWYSYWLSRKWSGAQAWNRVVRNFSSHRQGAQGLQRIQKFKGNAGKLREADCEKACIGNVVLELLIWLWVLTCNMEPVWTTFRIRTLWDDGFWDEIYWLVIVRPNRKLGLPWWLSR